MKIKREINGEMCEIELTSNELFNAYCEQQWNFDLNDIENELYYRYGDCAVDENFEALFTRLLEPNGITKEAIEWAAGDMRRSMDKYDCDFDYAKSSALDEMMSNLGITWAMLDKAQEEG